MDILNSSNLLFFGTLLKTENLNTNYMIILIVIYGIFNFIFNSIDKSMLTDYIDMMSIKIIDYFICNKKVCIEFNTHNVTYSMGYSDKTSKKKIYSTDFISLLDYIKSIDISKKKEILTTQLKDTSWSNRWKDNEEEDNRYQFVPINSSEDILLDKENKIFLKMTNRFNTNEKDQKETELDMYACVYCYYDNDYDKIKKIGDLNNFITKIRKMYLDKITKQDDNQYIFVYQKMENIDEETKLVYSEHINKHNKSFDNVIIEKKENLINYVKKFNFNPDKDVLNDFKKMGMPYKAGMLFWGSPGTGKTSTIKAILKETNRHGVIINLSNIESNKELEEVFRNRRINNKTYTGNQLCFILEDCDATKLSSIKDRKEQPCVSLTPNNNENNLTTEIKNIITVNQKGFDLSCFLNILDGIIELYGIMIIVTTNHPEKIDEALIRPGRIDFKYEFKKCNKFMIGEMLKLKFDLNDHQLKHYMNDINKIEDYIISPAEIQCLLFQSNNIDESLKNIILMCQKN